MVYDEYSDDIKNTYAKMTEDRERIADDKFYKYLIEIYKKKYYNTFIRRRL